MANSKRILTLDFLRGMAIFLMCIFHVFVNSSRLMDVDDPFTNIALIIIFLFIFIFAHFRGFFILISGTVNIYSMTKRIKKGADPMKLWRKQLGVGLFLVIFGHVKDTFINQWGIFREYYLAGGFAADNFDWAGQWEKMWQLGYTSEAIQSIGWCLLLTSTIYLIILKFNDVNDLKKNAIIMGFLALIFIYAAESIQLAFSDLVGYPIYGGSDPWNVEKQGIDYLTYYFIYDLAGAQAPIFPMMAYSLFGAIFGIYLNKQDLTRKFLKNGTRIGIGLMIMGSMDFIIRMFFQDSFEFDPNFQVHPSWFVLLAIGIQILLMMLCFKIFEFNKNKTPEQIKKQTLFIRRWGFLSLTIYAFQILEFIPRAILASVFPSSQLGQWSESPIGWVLLFMVMNILMWEGIIRLAEKIKMKGTLEWVLLYFNNRKKALDEEDPLNLEENVYKVEPVPFGMQN